jgi:hypothetical protein
VPAANPSIADGTEGVEIVGAVAQVEEDGHVRIGDLHKFVLRGC